MRLPDVLLCRAFVCISRFFLPYFAEEEKIEQNAKQNAEIREFSVKTRKKKEGRPFKTLWQVNLSTRALLLCVLKVLVRMDKWTRTHNCSSPC